MGDVSLGFSRPLFLLLLVVVPLFWVIAWRSLAGLGRTRWWLANGFRTVLFALFVVALAEIQFVDFSNRVAVIYLVDRSLSIDQAGSQRIVDFVRSSTEQFSSTPDELAGVISFGGRAALESPVIAGDLDLPTVLDADIQPEQTNLAAAIGLARAAFPPHSAKRIVVLTDGCQTAVTP